MSQPKEISIALVDDHKLLRKGLSNIIAQLGYRIAFEADNGIDLQNKIDPKSLPDIVLLDINMPLMDGFDSCAWLSVNYPNIKVIALSMYDEETTIIRIVRAGARGFLLKDSEPQELQTAIRSVLETGFYQSGNLTGKLLHSILKLDDKNNDVAKLFGLTQKEIEFLKLAATDKTYKEIADEMSLSPRTIDGYRDALLEKLQVKSRIGLVIFAIKYKIVSLN